MAMRITRALGTAMAAALAAACAAAGCAASPAPAPPRSPAAGAPVAGPAGATSPVTLPTSHLADVRQLTFGGENAEAYWSFDGNQLVLQARGPGEECDRIYRMDLRMPQPVAIPVSSGAGAATCSYFLPGDREVIYASTHVAAPAPLETGMATG